MLVLLPLPVPVCDQLLAEVWGGLKTDALNTELDTIWFKWKKKVKWDHLWKWQTTFGSSYHNTIWWVFILRQLSSNPLVHYFCSGTKTARDVLWQLVKEAEFNLSYSLIVDSFFLPFMNILKGVFKLDGASGLKTLMLMKDFRPLYSQNLVAATSSQALSSLLADQRAKDSLEIGWRESSIDTPWEICPNLAKSIWNTWNCNWKPWLDIWMI